MPTISLNSTVIARVAGALYGAKLGSASMAEARELAVNYGMDALVNALYARDFSGTPVANVAASLVQKLQITGASVNEATAFITGRLNGVADDAKGAEVIKIVNQFAGLTADATWGAAATKFNAIVSDALSWASTAANQDAAFEANPAAGVVTSFRLIDGFDNLFGSAQADTFTSRIMDNGNTLESGDFIDGGAGADTLIADIGTSQNFAITAETVNVETVKFRAQARSSDNPDNNTVKTSEVQIDAQRMEGVTRWENTNSRADLLIEDVRITDNAKITRDVTIAMVSTDPGHVDFGVYFDQPSLRKGGGSLTSGSSLTLEVANTKLAKTNLNQALFETPEKGFTFKMNGTPVTVENADFLTATTYAGLVTAVEKSLRDQGKLYNADTNPTGIIVSLGAKFTATDTAGNNVPNAGDTIILTNMGPEALDVGDWLFSDQTSSDTSQHTKMYKTPPATLTGELITSNIVLDEVGRGSMGGDLVVGGLSVGDTSTSKGVEQFDLTVERSSQLQTITSTNNALQVVTIRSGATAGDLTVLGTVGTEGGVNQALPGTEIANLNDPANWDKNTGDQHNAFGFNDLRVINAKNMDGKLNIDLQLSDRVVHKYLDRVDTDANAALDNTSFAYRPLNKTGQERGYDTVNGFDYELGTKDDRFSVNIDSENLAAAGTTSREDFVMTINGGTGDDVITTRIEDGSGTDATPWYRNSQLNANLSVSGDAGKDTIRTIGAGDFKIYGGADDDTVYADNSGEQVLNNKDTSDVDTDNNTTESFNDGRATWLVNVRDQFLAGDADRKIAAIVSDTNDTNTLNLYKTKVVVNYKGFETAVPVLLPSTGYKTTDLQFQQAMKQAINADPVLNKLLIAQDGPANTLIVRSLIDGAHNAVSGNELFVTLVAPLAGELTDAEAVEMAKAWALGGITTAAQAQTAIAGNVTTFNGLTTTQDGNYALADAPIVNVTTQGGAGNEVFTLDLSNVTGLSIGDTVVFDGATTTLSLAGAGADGLYSAAEVAAQIVLAGATTSYAAPVAAGSTVTYTAKAAGVLADATTASFVVTSAAANLNASTVTVTQGSAGVTAVNEVFTIDVGASKGLDVGDKVTFAGQTVTLADTNLDKTLSTSEIAAQLAAGIKGSWTGVQSGNIVTFTQAVSGPYIDVTAADFTVAAPSMAGVVIANTAAVLAAPESNTVTLTGLNGFGAGDTVTFSGQTVTLVDTDGNGGVDVDELGAQLVAGITTNWTGGYVAATDILTLTSKAGNNVDVTNIKAADFVVTAAAETLGAVVATTAQGVAGVAAAKESFVLDVTKATGFNVGDQIAFNGTTVTLSLAGAGADGIYQTGELATALGGQAFGTYTSAAAVGNTVTFTNSANANVTDAKLADFVVTTITGAFVDVAPILGMNSAATSDNLIEGGTGNDVLVLGTGAQSNDQVVFTGYGNGVDSVVYFDNGGAGNANIGRDYLNFKAYSAEGVTVGGTSVPTGLVAGNNYIAAVASTTAGVNGYVFSEYLVNATGSTLVNVIGTVDFGVATTLDAGDFKL